MASDDGNAWDKGLRVFGILALVLLVLGIGFFYLNRSSGFVPLSSTEQPGSNFPLSDLLAPSDSSKAPQTFLQNQPVKIKLDLDTFEWDTTDSNVSVDGNLQIQQGRDQVIEAKPGLTRLSLFSGTVRLANKALYLVG